MSHRRSLRLFGLMILALAGIWGCGPEPIDPRVEAALPEHGRAGSRVDVVGQRFSGTLRQISLNGAPAEEIFWEANRVRFRVPKVKAGAKMIVVTVDGRPSNALTFVVDP